MIKPEVVRDLLTASGLSQRGAARRLEINERTMRKYCSIGGEGAPHVIELALRQLIEEVA